MPKISNDWLSVIGNEFEKPYYLELRKFLKSEYRTRTIYPAADDIFNAFHYTPLSKLKVVIIGQDPYHGPNQAIGVSFAVPKDQRTLPPSLMNIYKELESDLGISPPTHGYLKKWTDEGVLLLNTVLTVRAHQASSHSGKGWEQFTDAAIRAVNNLNQPIVFFLWGRPAQRKKELLDNPLHLIIESPHPSPLSATRGFFGSKPFSQANTHLISKGIEPIDWSID
jgi:uracil-DNA glycosylase